MKKMEKFNKFLDTDTFYGFSYGVAAGTFFFSGVPIVVFFGLLIFIFTIIRQKISKKKDIKNV